MSEPRGLGGRSERETPVRSADSFSTFLEASRRYNPDQSQNAGDLPMKLLRTLKPAPMLIPDLMRTVEMSVLDLASALKTLEGAGLVELRGSGTSQEARLTGSGAQLVSLGMP